MDHAAHPFALDEAGGRSGGTVTLDHPPASLGVDE